MLYTIAGFSDFIFRINIVSHIGNHLQSEEEAAKQEVVSIVLDETYDGEGWEQNMALANILCRICASSDGELIPLFGDKGIEMQLIEKIKWYLPIEVCAAIGLQHYYTYSIILIKILI